METSFVFEIVNYKIVNGQYKTQALMNNALSKAGVNVDSHTTYMEEGEEHLMIERTPFKKIFEEYVLLRENVWGKLSNRLIRIEIEKPLVNKAYEILGVEKVREMKYHQYDIKRELIKLEHETADIKAFMLFDRQVRYGVPIPKAKIKRMLESIYSDLNLTKAAKATDIRAWYVVKDTTVRNNDGSTQACYVIITKLLEIKKAQD